MNVKVRILKQTDLESVAKIHSTVFPRQNASLKWATSNFSAFPRIMMFAAINDQNDILGYIQWLQKSGFRKEAVIELEQIAVLPKFQSKGVGTQLIKNSLAQVKQYIEKQGASVKTVLVTTRTDNAAQKLYKNTLGAKIEATISNLYSSDEVIMVAKF